MMAEESRCRVPRAKGKAASVLLIHVAVAALLLAPGASSAQQAPIGFLDFVDSSNFVAYGWALDQDVPTTSIDVDFYIDSVFVASVQTSIYRADVNAVHGVAGSHGFAWPIPSSFLDGQVHLLEVLGLNQPSGAPSALTGSGMTFVHDDSDHVHTPYDYHVASVSIVGSQQNFSDDFSDSILAPWHIGLGRPADTGAGLELREPGSFLQLSDDFVPGVTLLREVTSAGLDTTLSDGLGDFSIQTTWTDGAPSEDQLYNLSVQLDPNRVLVLGIYNISSDVAGLTRTQLSPGLYAWFSDGFYTYPAVGEIAGVIAGDDTTGHMVALSPAAFTGDVILELSYDDSNDTFMPRFSTDGGTSFDTSMATHSAAGWSNASIHVSADPRKPSVTAVPAVRRLGWFCLVGLVGLTGICVQPRRVLRPLAKR